MWATCRDCDLLWRGSHHPHGGKQLLNPHHPLLAAGPTTKLPVTDVSSLSGGHQQVTKALLTHNDQLIFSSLGELQTPPPPAPTVELKKIWVQILPLLSPPILEKFLNFSKSLSNPGQWGL